MSATVQTLERVFRCGQMELDDPAPNEPADKALTYYTRAYPFLAQATVGEGMVEGDRLVHEVIKPDSKSKG